MSPAVPVPPLQEEEEEEQGLLSWHPAHPKRQQQYALPGRQAPLLLQSRVSRFTDCMEHIQGAIRRCNSWRCAGFLPLRSCCLRL